MTRTHPIRVLIADDNAHLLDALTSLIEPLLIVVMGALVGGMVICLYLPMFDIINQIKQ